MIVTLPWPPTVNNYYATFNGRRLISKQGREFKERVSDIILVERLNKFLAGRLEIEIELYPPDNRRRDIDNTIKPLLDSLTSAGVFNDDSQIKKMTVTMFEEKKNCVQVKIT